MMKYCYKCKRDLPLDQWSKNKAKKDGLNSQCKSCTNEYSKKYYRRPGGPEKHKQFLYDRRRQNKERLLEHFGNRCADCGGSFPSCVYDFHHLDPDQKDFGFGYMATFSWENIEKEIIGKCVMLCANCHRIRHGTNSSR